MDMNSSDFPLLIDKKKSHQAIIRIKIETQMRKKVGFARCVSDVMS